MNIIVSCREYIMYGVVSYGVTFLIFVYWPLLEFLSREIKNVILVCLSNQRFKLNSSKHNTDCLLMKLNSDESYSQR